MTLSPETLRDVWDRALASPRGIRVKQPNHPAAVNFCAKLNRFRAQDRKANDEIFPEGDPRRGKSVFDALVCSIDKGDNSVLVRPGTLPEMEDL